MRGTYYESVKDLPDDVRRLKFEIEWNGRHIGWVSSYPIAENYEWIGEIKVGQTVYRAVGIDICESNVWVSGIGTNARRAFMNYYFENGEDELTRKLGRATFVCSAVPNIFCSKSDQKRL